MNPFLIEQTQEEFKATANFQKNAELTQVRLKRFCASSPDKQPSVEQGFDLRIKHSSVNEPSSNEETSFDVEIVFDALGDGNLEKVWFHIDCCYELKYKLRPGYSPSKEELSAFHEGNALFHCWPFAREFVQNATQRMGLTVPPIPMFRVRVKRTAILASGQALPEVIPATKKTLLKRAPRRPRKV